MVRRIIPDSDFESEEDTQKEVPSPKDNGGRSPSPLPLPEAKPPASTRILVRGNELKPEPRETYEYDSDIYTEDSSMGSFIVYSEEEGNQEEEAVPSDDDDAHSVISDEPPSPLPALDKLKLDSDSETDGSALLVFNPQPSPRKQTTTDKAISPPSKAPAKHPLKETTTNKPSKSFLQDREHLATTLLAAIDQKVMSGKLASATISTGGLKLIWSTKLRTAAGRAHWTHVKRPLGAQEQHDLKIELSTRLITSEEKMRDTLAHELCHCATWVIDNNPRANHGKQFKEWGSRITRAFPDIEVTTKHAYEIEYKFMYTCSNASCGLDFGRQKKIDLNRLVCGACKSKLFQTKGSVGKENRANPFGEFVKGHFAEVKSENPGCAHKEIMGILSRMYREDKERRWEVEEAEEMVDGVAVIDLT